MLSKLRTFWRMDLLRKKLFFEALYYSLKAFILLRYFPQKVPLQTQIFSVSTAENTHQLIAFQIRSSIKLANKYTFWTSKCRHEALQAKWLLVKYKLPCELYIGVRKNSARQLEGHAWTICRGTFITGSCDVNQYTIV